MFLQLLSLVKSGKMLLAPASSDKSALSRRALNSVLSKLLQTLSHLQRGRGGQRGGLIFRMVVHVEIDVECVVACGAER